eukprot:TRINITY_DN37229_c0_g1_i1.p1 TRINITY_DN37229_c0_g1~~TRINITY_DN37229_c0_g1_i1.p1  ORF type:complete len:103 (-),score=10.20 TRINITY_DN37229_c0_g1_i1:239-547(-)
MILLQTGGVVRAPKHSDSSAATAAMAAVCAGVLSYLSDGGGGGGTGRVGDNATAPLAVQERGTPLVLQLLLPANLLRRMLRPRKRCWDAGEGGDVIAQWLPS